VAAAVVECDAVAAMGNSAIDETGTGKPAAEDDGNRQRATDKGFLCRVALRASQLWDFVDARDIDKHLISIVILIGTAKVTGWAFRFAEAHMDKSGAELALVIASVTAPYMALQAAALGFYFKART